MGRLNYVFKEVKMKVIGMLQKGFTCYEKQGYENKQMYQPTMYGTNYFTRYSILSRFSINCSIIQESRITIRTNKGMSNNVNNNVTVTQ